MERIDEAAKYPTKEVLSDVYNIMNYFEETTGKRVVVWDKLGSAWKKELKEDITKYGFTDNGASIKLKLQKKVIKYKDQAEGVAKRILSFYPDGAFNVEDCTQAAVLELNIQFRNAYMSPSMWKHAFDGTDEITIGPSFLKQLDKALKGLKPNVDAGDGYVLKAVKGAVYKEMRKEDILTPHFRKIAKAINEFIKKIETTEKRRPSDVEIAREVGFSEKDATKYIALATLKSTEYDDAVHYNTGGDFGAKIKSGQGQDPGMFDKFSSPEIITLLSDELQKVWKTIDRVMPSDQKIVIELFIYEELSIKEISEVLGVQPKEIEDLYVDAIETMKDKVKMHIGL